MSVKIINELPKPELNERMESLKSDIREIIENRIPLCELENPPYASNTLRDQFKKAVRKVGFEYREERNGKWKYRNYDAFSLIQHKKDGIIHWYIKFDLVVWDNLDG